MVVGTVEMSADVINDMTGSKSPSDPFKGKDRCDCLFDQFNGFRPNIEEFIFNRNSNGQTNVDDLRHVL